MLISEGYKWSTALCCLLAEKLELPAACAYFMFVSKMIVGIYDYVQCHVGAISSHELYQTCALTIFNVNVVLAQQLSRSKVVLGSSPRPARLCGSRASLHNKYPTPTMSISVSTHTATSRIGTFTRARFGSPSFRRSTPTAMCQTSVVHTVSAATRSAGN